MKFFELHFNPKKIDTADSVFNCFCYEPKNIYERKMGYLFAVGELKNVLFKTEKLLDNLAQELKVKYYSGSLKSSPETALKESLKKVNEFLENLAKQGEVSWLGNLNFAVISLGPVKKETFEINFTKVGSVKILLIRPGKIIDIGKNLEYSEIEPYPLKIFGNIVTGKLFRNDIIAVLTKDVFDFFEEKKLLSEIAKISLSSADFGLTLREIFKKRDKEISKISGLCLIGLLTLEEKLENKRNTESIVFQREREKFSLVLTIKKIFAKAKLGFNKNLKFLKPAPKIFPYVQLKQKNEFLLELIKKKLILIALLVLLLLLGALLF
jgi:hypothetical protein